jgi:hypothetical protein
MSTNFFNKILKSATNNLVQSKPFFQAKLSINQPNDAYEVEADAMADKVMRMEMPSNGLQLKPLPISSVQRKCAHCEEEKKMQRKEMNGNETTADAGLENYVGGLQSGGQALSAEARSFYEPRFGYDFSNVKVHTDSIAAKSAQSINALAYTSRNNIVFNNGQYSPNTDNGKRLLGHELTHVVQQGTRLGSYINKKDALDIEKDQIKISVFKKDWGAVFSLLSKQWMKIMLEILDGYDSAELTELNTQSMQTANIGALGKGGMDRVSAAITTVGLTKASYYVFLPLQDLQIKIFQLPFQQRLEIIEFIKPHLLANIWVMNLFRFLSKPFAGNKAAGLDFSDRFLKHSDKLGFEVIGSQKILTEFMPTPYEKTQLDKVTDPAAKMFEQADVLFFSGHQYAQYHAPGVFTNENSTSCFNIGAIKKNLSNVKLVVSTGCATICKDTAAIFKDKFPNAMVLGYRLSAPTNGSIVADAFANEMAGKGPINLLDAAEKGKVGEAWKKVTNKPGSSRGQPGILNNGSIEFWNGRAWVTEAADSDANSCHYH